MKLPQIPKALRRLLKIVGAIVAFFLLAGLADQCWQVRRLNADQFLSEADQIERVDTIRHTSYIGLAGNRAYLEQWRMGRWTRLIFWIPVSELPADLAEKLKAGKPPWTPFLERTRAARPTTTPVDTPR